MKITKKMEKMINTIVEQVYSKIGDGVQVPMLSLPLIYRAGKNLLRDFVIKYEIVKPSREILDDMISGAVRSMQIEIDKVRTN